MGFLGGTAVKNPLAKQKMQESRLDPGSGRYPGVENGNQLQYSHLENSKDRGVWRATGHRVAKS